MDLLKKIQIFIFFIALTVKIFAEDQKAEETSKQIVNCETCERATKSTMNSDYPICEDTYNKGYNGSAGIDVCGKIDTFITASFIYFELLSDHIDLGVLETNTTSNNRSIQILSFEEEYKPGFKVGIGTNFKHDNWDLFSEYTRLHASETTTISVNLQENSSSFRDFWFIDHIHRSSSETFTSPIQSRWKMNLDKIDLQLARSYYVGTNLIFRPFIGGSVHWIDQSYQHQFTFIANVIDFSNNLSLKNDSWAIGPKFGINMSWFFFKNFMILAKGAVDIMFASNKISGVHVLTGAANISPILNPNLSKHKKYILRDVENFSLGLGWGSYFRSNRYNFNLAVSYEIQRYSNTNYMAAYDETFGSTQFLDFTKQINPGDLFLHGITVTSRFDF